MTKLDHSLVRSLLDYDPETGIFVWRYRGDNVWDARFASHEAGFISDNTKGIKTRKIRFGNRNYIAARIAWLYIHAVWPPAEIDHINGNPLDNRLSNLRLASRTENIRNRGIMKSNTSGYKGVHFKTDRYRPSPWQASIAVNNKRISLGFYATPEEAAKAYAAAALVYHGEFARLK